MSRVSCSFHGKMYFAGSYTDGSSVFGTVPPEGKNCNFAAWTDKEGKESYERIRERNKGVND